MDIRYSAAILLGVVMLAVSGCSSSADDNNRTTLRKAKDLGRVEIKKYQGQRLTDFEKLRDNSIQGPQEVDTAKYRLTIDGLVSVKQELSYRQVLGMDQYQKLITLHCVEGWSAKGLFEGALVGDILKLAVVKPGANTLIFHAADGYTSSLPLKAVLDKKILLAYKVNNKTLTARSGFPFQLIAEDKLGYKWVKWLRRIEVSSDSTYRGFWESRGYDNKADY
ncbi:MAG: molybdopterin-dependent oxidoreductase [Candidatus Edwardsbacteria bacterium]|nr:molybdopterin-dependent oxidoreductase [Candidatus Edwardsbacteria bacterium]MBU1576638.1 molybdopterin-dependent oxidoreductase [Candidatus Edwardsbacteria bacterium]MBU2462981.1 molybdopterin-dependent oxidoreductase [Candidatus Edwardsbacteria bacterium]MBU2594466.1 molybdopterin-dependent oxidoreductase [Candidatus Edwardsbacteria bacterium]